MPFDRQQVYITCTGQIGTGGGAGEEIFSFGLRVTGSTTHDSVAALAAVDTAAIRDAYSDFITDAGSNISSRVHALAVKFSPLSAAGTLLDDPVIEALNGGTGVSGGGSGPSFPNQVAIAVSLRTVTNIGRAHKGRFYVPVPSMPILTSGRINSAYPPDLADNASLLLQAINSEFGTDAVTGGRVAIMSNIGAGTTRSVTRVLVGDVLDTIRSRRNAFAETYSETAVP